MAKKEKVMEEKKVVDMYGNELKAGDSVCFIHKHSMESQYIVKAIAKEIKPMKATSRHWDRDKGDWVIDDKRGWIIIDKYVDDWYNNDKKAKKKVMAERVIKCY